MSSLASSLADSSPPKINASPAAESPVDQSSAVDQSSKFSLQDAVSRFNLKSPTLTPSIGALILAAVPKNEWSDKKERKYVVKAVKAAITSQNGVLPKATKPYSPRGDPRGPFTFPSPTPTSPLKISTNYPLLLTTLPPFPSLSFVSPSSSSTYLFSVTPITDHLSLPSSTIINQFPYEGGIVQKDLLPLTVRAYCYVNDVKPKWWLECYDMSTEFHLFKERWEGGFGKWVIKESKGTHSKGTKVVGTVEEAAEFLEENGGKEYIAQEVVMRPMLVGGRKFDLRVWCFVRSFGDGKEQFEGYVSKFVHARVSNKIYDVERLDDEEVFLTISTYNEELDNGERLTPERLKRRLLEENPDFNWEKMFASITQTASELFRGAAPSIGHWPRSRAYYGLDMIMTVDDSGEYTSNLLEVNFAGDFDSARETQRQAVETSEGPQDDYDTWLEDLAEVLFYNNEVTSERLVRL
ncbi:hypothetical protein TrVE_jg9363 [Triparma verrucosa]|uniref:Tubulin-tyrosine ligase n=1 Tax=Triparma verrucosa TaxID=1606542 RepID=A0A9W6Z9Y5_9STRA|nr:hypothetical protein TrVE_jg9363 [Triparma verrucosa]